jgi:hypothetical protein
MNFVWQSEELQIMEIFLNENFFPSSILSNSIITPTIDILSLGAASQNRNTAIGAFEKMLSLIYPRVLRDLIKIIRLEQVRFYLEESKKRSFIFRIRKIIIYGEYVGV